VENAVAGSADDGMKWRRRYLEITYGCGAYRPYETLVREAARDVGLPERLGAALDERWDELSPWPEAPAIPEEDRGAARRRNQLLGPAGSAGRRPRRRAVQARRDGRERRLLQAAPEVYRAVLHKLGTRPERTLFVAGSALDVPGAKAMGMPVYWHNRVGLSPHGVGGDDARPDFLEKSLEPLGDLFRVSP